MSARKRSPGVETAENVEDLVNIKIESNLNPWEMFGQCIYWHVTPVAQMSVCTGEVLYLLLNKLIVNL